MTDLRPQIDWISRLVAFDTSSGRSNLPLIDDVVGHLAGLGVRLRRIANAAGDRANLYAVVGPDAPGGIVLSGHTDVVPVGGQDWSTDPWRLEERDGRLYGRGACDMKGFCGVALSLLPEFLAARLERPLILAFSYDEEIGCVGAPAMIAEMALELPKPSAVIIGEPTMMDVVVGHKGSAQFRTTVTGVPAHSSDPGKGLSAVEVAARLIGRIGEMRAANQRSAPPDSPFEPPYTTLSANVVQGGSQANVMAGRCAFEWDVRVVPGEHPQMYRDALEASARDATHGFSSKGFGASVAIESTVVVPPFVPVRGDPAVALAQMLTGARSTRVVSYASEAGQYQQAGFPTVLCGPGSIEQAHRADEFVSLEQVNRCTQFIRRLVPLLARSAQ